MLPLWLIDIRSHSARRDEFRHLLRQIDHVWMPEDFPESDVEEVTNTDNLNEGPSAGTITIADISQAHDENLLEQIDRQDRHTADRNAHITGNYWRYTAIDSDDFSMPFHSELPTDVDTDLLARNTAEELYRFQNTLVKHGQEFIRMLRKSNAPPDIKINIVVLGDITEPFTRLVFPAIAGLLQKEKGRMLPHHIHQGMEVIGMLYVPSNINTLHVSERKSMLRTLREIDVQHRVNDLRGYDHMMYYQDVPNRTQAVYPLLSDRQLAQYLLQCLVHLYLACNDSHPLLSGTSSADVFYFAMGATSIHFDTRQEDLKIRRRMMAELIGTLKKEGDCEHRSEKITLIDADEYMPKSFFSYDALSQLDIEFNEEETGLHPIRNFFARHLKRLYYNTSLRYYSTRLMRRITSVIEENTRTALDSLATESRRRFTDASRRLFERIRTTIGHISAADGGLPAINNLLREFQQKISLRRKSIHGAIEQEFWAKIEQNHVDKTLINDFIEYHGAYEADQNGKNENSQQIELKKQAVKHLNGILSREATMLARLCRTLLLGIVGAFGLIPLLCYLSPHIVDLGDVYKNRFIWGLVLFLLPVLAQLTQYFFYCRAKKRARKKLYAMFLHDAFARVANRIDSEINAFYDKITDLAERYIKRCEMLRNSLGSDITNDPDIKSTIPETTFNQPLIGGTFGYESLLPESEADDTMVRINYISYKFNELNSPEYFIFINQHKNIFAELFKDVSITEPLVRRFNENGEEQLITREQQEIEQQQLWRGNTSRFYAQLSDAVNEAIMQRENPTVGEKIAHYCRSSADHADLLVPAVEFATINGEFTSSADSEYADVKLNDSRVEPYLMPLFATQAKKAQVDRYNPVYTKFLFITRWRCFEQLNLNRVLPTEDFDEKVHIRMVYDAELRDKKRRERNLATHSGEAVDNTPKQTETGVYNPRPSSLLLWALCLEDSSTEWFRLFDSEQFAKAYNDKKIYRECLNQND